MRFRSLTLATLLAASAVPAHAAYTTIDYTGTVARIYPADGGPDAPADIFVGQKFDISVTYDPSQLVAYGAGRYMVDNGKTGAPMVIYPAGVSLALDSSATYTITLGSHVWKQTDDTAEDQGYYYASGEDPNAVKPLVAYDGNPSTLIGLTANAVNSDSLEFYMAPLDFILQDASFPVYGGSTLDGGFGFAGNYDSAILDPTGAVTNDTLLAVRAAALAEGQVPEPSSILLLMLGGVCLWKLSRRKAGAGRGMGFVAA